MESNYNSSFPNVVIIGAGFGGIELAKSLKNKEVNVLLVDKHNYHTFQPLMYQVATGSLEADSIAFSVRKTFEGQKNFRFRIAEVNKINTDKNSIETNIGDIEYDYLVVATGSTTNFFGNKDIEQHALPMKSIVEALNLRSAILQNIEAALLLPTKEEREPYFVMGIVPEGFSKDQIANGNRIATDEISRVKGLNNVFAIGDVSSSVSEAMPKGLPGVAPVAIQQGKHLAKNILHLIKNEPTVDFKYNDQGSMATIGRNKAVVDLGKIKFQGFFAWLTWMFVHLILLMGFRNKVVVFINWLGSYVSYNGGTRLIIRPYFKKEFKPDQLVPESNTSI
ncbi:MAG: NAD(P)/FAD-dependent oxidoreductase [Sphingobacteriaceae bacterium]|nr:MAG: NAD(P)/FAD-dependent oxidoreductase [Sphingobacteriaceae bacterium]